MCHRCRRSELGLSLEDAAPLCGVHWSALSHVERGKPNLSIVTLLKIAQGLTIAPGKLVEGFKPQPRDTARPPTGERRGPQAAHEARAGGASGGDDWLSPHVDRGNMR